MALRGASKRMPCAAEISSVPLCMGDSACRQTVDCQYNCYGSDAGNSGQTCANACPGTTNANFVAYANCHANRGESHH